LPMLTTALRARCTLPSRPTRRSSDLLHQMLPRRVVGDRRGVHRDRCIRIGRALHHPGVGLPEHILAALVGIWAGWAEAGARRPRSEEHTSELQSRENLVCRLLLEKKK